VSDPHAQALLGLLLSDPDLTVYDGPAPDGATPPYVVLYVTSEDASDRLHGDATTKPVWGYTHAVGANATAARRVADLVRARLLDVHPTVPGWVNGPIRHYSSRPPTDVEVAGAKYLDQVDVWRFVSDPA